MVWSSRPDGGLSQEGSMLVLDVFSCHKTDDTKALLGRTNTDLIIIPGGMNAPVVPRYVHQQAIQGRAASLLDLLDNEWREDLHKEWEHKKDQPFNDLRLDCQGVGGDTVRHHQESISELLHLQQHGRHRGRHYLGGGGAYYY